MAGEFQSGRSQTVDGRLRDDCLQNRGEQLAQHAPSARPGQAVIAQRGESSSSSTSGSSKRMISRCAYGLAERGSLPGGPCSPMRLFRRLKGSSIRHRNR